jgi:hypothetical protein
MHPGIRELLTLRDGAPVAARSAEHVNACKQCGAEIARLRELRTQLRQLPGFAPPQRTWTTIEQTLSNPRPVTTRALGKRAALLIAGLLGATLLSALLWQSRRDRLPTNHPSINADFGSVRAQSLPSLVARSQRLEALLRGLPRPAVERAATSAAIDELQTHIQMLDVQLSGVQLSGAEGGGLDRAQAQQLWAARVQLLDSLFSLRYAEHAARSDFWSLVSTGDI